MCGRFLIKSSKKKLEKFFQASFVDDSFKPRYNAAPTQQLPVIINQDPKKIQLFHWGYIPFWAKDEKIGNRMINSRAETISEKPMFKKAFAEKRCLVITDGFYEWQKSKDGKIPYLIKMKDDQPFTFAGIWSSWKNPQSEVINSFSIITTEANSLCKKIHDRMPVILKKENYRDWLDQKNSTTKLQKLLKAFDPQKMEAYEVSKDVNSPANNTADVIKAA
ncbi:SOS response-associated peptidase [Patescibacteria group bacterium]